MNRPILLSLVFLLLLGACSTGVNRQSESDDKKPSLTSSSPGIAQLWSQTCGLCHATGAGGAPQLGNKQQWQPRLAQGKDVLLQHTIDGFNDMPPLGYCMSCEYEELSLLIDFMTGEGQ